MISSLGLSIPPFILEKGLIDLLEMAMSVFYLTAFYEISEFYLIALYESSVVCFIALYERIPLG